MGEISLLFHSYHEFIHEFGKIHGDKIPRKATNYGKYAFKIFRDI